MLIPALIAEVDPAFTGQWISVAVLIIGGASTITSLAAIFATRREVESLNKRIDTLETRLDNLANEFGDATREIARDIGNLKESMPMQIIVLLRNTGVIK